MRCFSCGSYYPYDQDLGSVYPCLYCSSNVVYGAEEYLSLPELGVVAERRDQQVQVTNLIESTIRRNGICFVEAGTGVGKSFAYILPSLLASPGRVLISTAKKTLQQQLFTKDVPHIVEKLGGKAKFAVAYGVGNYLCKRDVLRHAPNKDKATWTEYFETAETALTEDLRKSKYGRRLKVLSDYKVDNCDGPQCKFYNSCGYIEDRKKIGNAKIVIANHWLFGAHIARPQSSLGAFTTFVVDEAHKIEDGVRSALEVSLAKVDFLAAFDLADDQDPLITNARRTWENIFKQRKSGALLAAQVEQFTTDLPKLFNKRYGEEFLNRISAIQANVIDWRNVDATKTAIYIEQDEQFGERITRVPVDIGFVFKALRDPLNAKVAEVYVSATLAVNGEFNYFANVVATKVDDESVATLKLPSAFDVDKQAILYLSKEVPEPTRDAGRVDAYRIALAKEIEALVTANQGDAFVLFTAKDEMLDVANRINYGPLLVQGEETAAATLDRYKRTPNAVLFGLKSFWEGVDIPGDKLSLVIITRIPFPAMDPVLDLKKSELGTKAFHMLDLPLALMDLRQGAGRLIRSKTDRGVLALLDARVFSKPYGKRVISELGFAKPTSNKDAVLKALTNLAKTK